MKIINSHHRKYENTEESKNKGRGGMTHSFTAQNKHCEHGRKFSKMFWF